VVWSQIMLVPPNVGHEVRSERCGGTNLMLVPPDVGHARISYDLKHNTFPDAKIRPLTIKNFTN
jgi:hypothetical protein